MAKQAHREGKGPCPICTATVSFKRSSGGKLTYTCPSCDTSGYAEQGGDGEKKWLATIAKPAAADPDIIEPPPPARAARAGFDLSQLGA